MARLNPTQRGFTRDRHSGPIPGAVAGRGIVLAIRNARRLFDDALVLYRARRFPSAVALAILALEEMDKPMRILRLATMLDARQRNAEWSGWTQHLPKLSRIVRTVFVRHKGQNGTSTFARKVPRQAARLKERCIYLELLDDTTWSQPQRMVNKFTSRAVIGVALYLFQLHLLVTFRLQHEMSKTDFEPKKVTPRARQYLRWLRGKQGTRLLQRELRASVLWLGAKGNQFYGKRVFDPKALEAALQSRTGW